MAASPNESLLLGNYVVCVIDLLGQKDNLRGWSTIPADGQITESFKAALKATIGAVEGFYSAFTSFFEAQRAPTQFTARNMNLLTGRDRELYQRQKDFELGVHQFSDTFVFYAPLGNTSGELCILPVYAILSACCMAMLLSLAAGIPLRGGIEIGPGIKLPELSFYGPALAGAHRLESRVAQYPRIVVGESVVGFVQHTPKSVGSGFIDSWFLEMLKVCRQMLIVDCFDSRPIVDWLGEGFRRMLGSVSEPPFSNALKETHEFVGQTAKSLQERFDVSKNPEDEKLLKRYLALYRYLLARLPDWGMGIEYPDSPPSQGKLT